MPTRKSLVRLTDRLDMTLDVYLGSKTLTQHNTTILFKGFLLLNGAGNPKIKLLVKKPNRAVSVTQSVSEAKYLIQTDKFRRFFNL